MAKCFSTVLLQVQVLRVKIRGIQTRPAWSHFGSGRFMSSRYVPKQIGSVPLLDLKWLWKPFNYIPVVLYLS